jgi:hypothetical protein
VRIYVDLDWLPGFIVTRCTAHLLRSPLSVIFLFQTHLPLSVRGVAAVLAARPHSPRHRKGIGRTPRYRVAELDGELAAIGF